MSTQKFEVQRDCFAYMPNKKDPKQKCIALNDLYCAKEYCAFYKPKKEVK